MQGRVSDTQSPRRSWRGRPVTFRRIAVNLVFLALLLGWLLLLRPTWLGGPTTIVRVTGESMEPGMHTGDLVVVHAKDAYAVGDVVAFRVPSGAGSGRAHVIHRIIDEEDGVFTLRGDNNSYDDPWDVRTDDIAGRLWLHVPGAGTVVARLADPVVAATLLASLTAFLVIMGPTTSRDESEPDGEQDAEARELVEVSP